MTLAGTPATIAHAGTSRVTTAPAPITARSPIVTPALTTALAPMKTWSPKPSVSDRLGIGAPDTQRRAVECV